MESWGERNSGLRICDMQLREKIKNARSRSLTHPLIIFSVRSTYYGVSGPTLQSIPGADSPELKRSAV